MNPSKDVRRSLLVPALLDAGISRARSGAYKESASALMAEADGLLGSEPPTVLDKQHVPPSGDKRDFFSLSIYFWPDPAKPDGLPYIPRDGDPNPERDEYDRPGVERMAMSVDTLSLAYLLSGDEKYAEKGVTFLRKWFLDENTGMRPNMLYAQYIPGDNVVLPWKEYPARFVPGADGRKGIYVSFGGVIEHCVFFPVIDAVRILAKSAAWTPDDDRGIRAWFRKYSEWLLTHQHGLDEAGCRNNHGSWYWAAIASFLELAGECEKARHLVGSVLEERLRLQIEPDGSQPEELVRAISKSYTAFTINSFVNLAVAMERCGWDAWAVETPDGRSIGKALEWFLPFLTGQKVWEWKQIKPFSEESMIGPLAAWLQKFPESNRSEIFKALPVPTESRFHLLYDTGIGAN